MLWPHPTQRIMIWTKLNLSYLRMLWHKFQLFKAICFWEDLKKKNIFCIYILCKFLSLSPLHGVTLFYHKVQDLKTLESTLSEDALTQVSTFQAHWFLRFINIFLGIYLNKNETPLLPIPYPWASTLMLSHKFQLFRLISFWEEDL